ncbi:hypothetical protein HanRHA438_Chr12g0535891 [Helianthus annuus]|nr:hypothetical protein HanXRQr2_Chr13g0582781 [Helianthus annuus]KAF5776434.1 hypothetical protein HanXRQr2_Chr12g0524241 [Helianthus annuus]KAJ0443127.1 hypothetical protein HanIR_Chr16g0817311 [Helianthus annuus]KAJ0488157.1 hypothetical protein HanHA300_Chr12g0429921 [Helianthus annuus]KAJ0491532.1 hypothetical protein HanIR_Chr12g0564871 [Helianthus annuus]
MLFSAVVMNQRMIIGSDFRCNTKNSTVRDNMSLTGPSSRLQMIRIYEESGW